MSAGLVPSGWGRYDARKRELCRKLEIANINLVESQELITQIFEPTSGQKLGNDLYRIREKLRELKGLVREGSC